MRTFSVSVVGPTLGGEIAFVVDDEVVLIQVIVFGQVGTRVEFYPGRIGPEAVAHDEVADPPKEVVPGNLSIIGVGRVAWNYFTVVPQELGDRNSPLIACRPATLAQHPGGHRVFETIDCVAEHDVVFPLQIRKLVVIISRRSAVGQYFVQIRVCIVMKNGVAPRWVAILRRAE